MELLLLLGIWAGATDPVGREKDNWQWRWWSALGSDFLSTCGSGWVPESLFNMACPRRDSHGRVRATILLCLLGRKLSKRAVGVLRVPPTSERSHGGCFPFTLRKEGSTFRWLLLELQLCLCILGDRWAVLFKGQPS